MARMPNTMTKAELQEVHEAKMAGKFLDRARYSEQAKKKGLSAWVRYLLGRSGSVSNFNRHTGKPHEHKREIARNLKRLSA